MSKHEQLLELISQAILISGELSERMADPYSRCMHNLRNAKIEALRAVPPPNGECGCDCHHNIYTNHMVPCCNNTLDKVEPKREGQ